MAKIGNEAKLILKLAKERMEAKKTTIAKTTGGDVTFQRGYIAGAGVYQDILEAIVLEMER